MTAATGSQFIGMDISDREFYREIVAGKDWVVSDLILSKTTQQPSFTISRGIRNERGELLGIIVAGILPAKLDRVLAVERPGDAGVSLLDSKGMNAYRYPATQYTWEQRNWLKLYPIIGEVLKGKEVVTTSHESKYKPGSNGLLPSPLFLPSVGSPLAAAPKKRRWGRLSQPLFRKQGLFCSSHSYRFSLPFALSRTISSSVITLRNHALSLGRGGTQNPLTISGPAEIKDLAEAFNKMAEEIRFREEALRESTLRWAVTLGSIGDGVIASDTDGRVTFLNPMAEVLTGWSQAEAAGKPVKEVFRIVNEYTRAVVEDPVSKVLQTGLVVGLANHTVLLRKDGGELPIDDSGAPIRDAEGRVFGVVLVFRDISERKQAEEVLRLTQASIDVAAEMVAWFTPDGRVRYVNDATCRTLGYSRDELLNMTPLDFSPGFTWELYAEHWEDVRKRKSFTLEVTHRRKDGTEYPAEVLVNHVVYGGQEYIFAYGHDITKRKQAEEALRASESRLSIAKQAAALGIHDYDVPSGTIQWDARVRELWGVGSEEPITYELFMSGVYAEDRANLQAAVERALDPAKGEHYSAEYRVTSRQDGITRWIAATGKVFFRDGRAVRLIGTVANITERKQAEEALQRLNETLEQRVSERTELAEVRAKQLQALAMELIEAEEHERRRLADLLHDDLQQSLAAARMQLQGACECLPPDPMLANVDQILGESLQRARRLSRRAESCGAAPLRAGGIP